MKKIILILMIFSFSSFSLAINKNNDVDNILKQKEIISIKMEIIQLILKIKEILINFDNDREVKLKKPKKGKIYFSAFPDFGGTEDKVSVKKILDFEKLVNKKIFWAYFSQNWYNGLEFPKKEIDEIRKAGSVPFVRFLPHTGEYIDEIKDKKKINQRFSLKKIIDGEFDSELIKWAKEAKKDGQMILFDYAVEPNSDWFSWSGIYNGGFTKNKYGNYEYPDGPEKWRDSYRHIIDIFNNEGVKNITYFFHPNLVSEPDVLWNKPERYYPGDNYIDWIGISYYGPQNEDEDYWELMSDVVKEKKKELFNISKNKPFAILEFGVSDNNFRGKKTDWIKDAFETIKKAKDIKFSAISYWHETWDEDGVLASIRVDSSESSLKVFKKEINDRIFIVDK